MKKLCTIRMAIFFVVIMFGVMISGKTTKAAEYYNVTSKEFGAIPNDGKSDADAIRKALKKAIGAKSIVTVYIPAGTYHIDRILLIYSNTHLILSPNAKIVRMDNSLSNNMLHAVDQLGEMTRIGGYNMCHDITVEGGTWDGGNANKAKNGTDLMRFDHGRNITVKNTTIKNVYNCHHLELIALKNAKVINCHFSGFVYDRKHVNEMSYGREAIQIESVWTDNPSNLRDISQYWAKGTKLDGTSCQNILIEGCTFANLPSAVGQHHFSKSKGYRPTERVIIRNNKIIADAKYNYFKYAIPCGGMNKVTIANNVISGPYEYAVQIYKSNDIVVQGNTISGSRHNGISIFDKGNVTRINNNTISNIKQHGISITSDARVGKSKTKGTGIFNNTIKNCKKNGISIAGNYVSFVANNSIRGCKNNGISMTKGKAYAITKNKISKCKIGIYIYKNKKLKKKPAGNKIKKCKYKMI